LVRYAINDAAVDWTAAEEQVKNLATGPKGTSSVISLKTTTTSGPKNKDGAAGAGQKRKSSDGDSSAKKSRRSIKKAKR
jgi:N-acetyltransferase 10